MRLSHHLTYFLSFKGSLLSPDATLTTVFNELCENGVSSSEMFEKLQTIMTFEDFIEHWCRFCTSRIWNIENPALETGLEAADQFQSSEEISEPSAEQPPLRLSLMQNLQQLFRFISDDATSKSRSDT